MPESEDEKIYTFSSDAKGHGVTLGFRIPPELDRLVSVITENPTTPYKTKSDFLRDALWHRANYWQKRSLPELSSGLKHLAAVDRILREEETALNFYNILNRLEAVLANYARMDALEECRKLVAEVLEQVEGFNDFWRRQYKAEIQKRFAHYLKVPLQPGQEGKVAPSGGDGEGLESDGKIRFRR